MTNSDPSRRGSDFESLFAAQREIVRQQLARLVPAAEVDDLLQETLVKAARAWASFRGEADAGTWLHQIAHRTALDHLRSRRHREAQHTGPLAADEAENAPGPAALIEPPVGSRQLERHEMHGCIREYVGRLPPAHRVVIELKDLEGLTNPQIAERLGVSLDAAKIRLHRARTALRELLAEGCEFYQSEHGTLACDRRPGQVVSLTEAISSKELRPEDGAGRAEPAGPNLHHPSTPMSSCCAAPQSSAADSAACAAPGSPVPAGSQYTAVADEFVAIGAAIGANCEPCLRHHVREALKVGISAADIAQAVARAAKIKATPAANILKLAERLIQEGRGTPDNTPADAGGGCGCST